MKTITTALRPAPRALSLRLFTAAVLPLLLSACDPLTMTVVGVGSSLGVSHHLNGIAYRTFTESMVRVRYAALTALKRMSITVSDTTATDSGELIKATAGNRHIEIEIESLTPRTTRIRAIARTDSGLFVDASTAAEIITQTEKVLGT